MDNETIELLMREVSPTGELHLDTWKTTFLFRMLRAAQRERKAYLGMLHSLGLVPPAEVSDVEPAH